MCIMPWFSQYFPCYCTYIRCITNIIAFILIELYSLGLHCLDKIVFYCLGYTVWIILFWFVSFIYIFEYPSELYVWIKLLKFCCINNVICIILYELYFSLKEKAVNPFAFYANKFTASSALSSLFYLFQ